MKKILVLTLALLIGPIFISTGFARPTGPAGNISQENITRNKAPTPQKRASKLKIGAPGFVGKVTIIDTTMIAVKGKKAAVTFDAKNPKLKGYKAIADIVIGDTVSVKYKKDGVMITKLIGDAKEKKTVKEKKLPMEEAVTKITCSETGPCKISAEKLTESKALKAIGRIACIGAEPCTASLEKQRELTELWPESLIVCSKIKPCTVSEYKPRQVLTVRRVTCFGANPCTVFFD